MEFSIFMTVQTSYVSHFHQSPPSHLEPNSNSVRIPFAKKKFHSNYFFPGTVSFGKRLSTVCFLNHNDFNLFTSRVSCPLSQIPLLFMSSFYAITSSCNVIDWEALGTCKLLKKYTIIMNIVSTSVMMKLTSEQRQNPFLQMVTIISHTKKLVVVLRTCNHLPTL